MSIEYGQVGRVKKDDLEETDVETYLPGGLLGAVVERTDTPLYGRHPTDEPEDFTDEELEALREGVVDLYEEKLEEGDFVAAASIGEMITRDSVYAEHAYWGRIEHAHELHSASEEDADGRAINLLLEAAWVAERFNLSDHHDPYNTVALHSYSLGERETRKSDSPRRRVIGPLRMAYDIMVQAVESEDSEVYEALRELEEFRQEWGLRGPVSPRDGEYTDFTESLARYESEQEFARKHVQNHLERLHGSLRTAARTAGRHSLSDEFGDEILEEHAGKAPEESEIMGDHKEFLEEHEKIARHLDRSPLITADDYRVVLKE